MKKLLILLTLLSGGILCFSQNYFECLILQEGEVVREARHVVETPHHGFIISCDSRYIYQNDMLVSISPDGEIVKSLEFQIDGKSIKYGGLFRHSDNEGEYLAIATLVSGSSTSDYIQKEVAIIHLDNELNVLNQNVYDFGDDFIHLEKPTQDRPRFLMDNDNNFIMVSHCLKTEGFCYLFAKLGLDGAIVGMKEDHSMNASFDMLMDFFVRDKTRNDYGIIKYWQDTVPGGGGDWYYRLDSTLICTKVNKLSGLDIKIVQDPNQPYPDTTFSYRVFGHGEYYNDSLFLITSGGYFLKHLGGSVGYCHFTTLIDDSLNVIETKVWDVNRQFSNNQTTTVNAETKALCITDSAIFHCGIMGIKEHTHYVFPPTTVTVSKFDKELNLIWRRYYGNNGDFYDINTIQATEDGGCILTGIYVKSSGVQEVYSYILKVDENGYDNVGENVESIAKPYFCYPNPAKDIIYIEFSPDVNCKSVEIYDMDGRLAVETFPETSQSPTISIANLTPGLYLIKVRMSDGKEYSEKIVVK